MRKSVPNGTDHPVVRGWTLLFVYMIFTALCIKCGEMSLGKKKGKTAATRTSRVVKDSRLVQQLCRDIWDIIFKGIHQFNLFLLTQRASPTRERLIRVLRVLIPNRAKPQHGIDPCIDVCEVAGRC